MKRPCPELFRGTVSASKAAEDKSGTASKTSVTWESLPLVALQHRVVWRGMALVMTLGGAVYPMRNTTDNLVKKNVTAHERAEYLVKDFGTVA